MLLPFLHVRECAPSFLLLPLSISLPFLGSTGLKCISHLPISPLSSPLLDLNDTQSSQTIASVQGHISPPHLVSGMFTFPSFHFLLLFQHNKHHNPLPRIKDIKKDIRPTKTFLLPSRHQVHRWSEQIQRDSIRMSSDNESHTTVTIEGNAKPLPVQDPVVWAEKRQSLCDALPYFKMHQGSLYSKRLVPKGFLIDGEFTHRDMMNGDIVITSLTADGDMERVRECRSPALKSIMKALREDIPMGVVVGKSFVDCHNYPLLPVQAPHAYNVLDWFNVTDVWVERDARNEFVPRESHTAELPRPRAFPAGHIQCQHCKEIFSQPFEQGWACLNGKCEQHFVLDSGSLMSDLTYSADCAAVWAWCVECKHPSKTIFEGGIWTCLRKDCMVAFQFPLDVNASSLAYSAEFISERTDFAPPPQPLRPALPTLGDDSCGTEIEFRRGIVCPECFGCSRRRNWDRWVYETPGCPFVLIAPPPPYPLCRIEKENWEINRRKSLKQSRLGENIAVSRLTIGAYSVYQYLLPHVKDRSKVIGSVHIFRATASTNARPDGPNSLWDEMQLAANQGFGLQRNPVRLAGRRSSPRMHVDIKVRSADTVLDKTEVLTRHFQQNWGAPYKFVVNVLSKSFEEAPDAILKALMRLRWAGRESVRCTTQAFSAVENGGLIPAESLATEFVDFNELLSLGYMEGDRISVRCHSPEVPMLERPMDSNSCTPQYHDDGEDTLGPTVATLSLGSPAVMAFRMKKKYNSAQREMLRFPIYHGDMVVMHGTDIHQFYEIWATDRECQQHKVDPAGMRRFAMTSRNIVLDTLDEQTRLEAMRKGHLPERAHDWQYDGL
ncbi:hypothetical protein ACRALDRAFT_2016840 [Sodiomyces alcalophilus JCM 7366]|uniref:uncharacterized protein n=1 Tax=Sodiomyces alcalophilus JCM 7366 TaxID=591952 RepID=UPI0039B3B81C